jgi:hypothetical protein
MKYLTNEDLLKLCNLKNTFVNPYNFGYDDFFVLDVLTRFVNPNIRSLEIGTCKGYSGAIIAKNTQHLLTVDIHPNRQYNINVMQSSELPCIDEIGMHSFCINNISQLLTDSSNLKNIPFGLFDFIFIDGSHDTRHVEEDTEFALSHINSGGIICWHDYSNVLDVTNFLNNIKHPKIDIIYHAGQWCAFTQVK